MRQIPSKVHYNCLQAICEIVEKVRVEIPTHISRNNQNLYLLGLKHTLTHSIFIVPAGKCKQVFVSLHKPLKVADGTQGFAIKETIMLTFDHNDRLLATKEAVQEIVSLQIPFVKGDPKLIWTERRISVMQQLKGSAYFPENFAMVLYKGKRVPKLKIFQEKALCSLLNFHNEHQRLETLPEQSKILICKELVRALHELADHGITHRDIKPENILVFIKDGIIHVKLSDLGFACSLKIKAL